MKYKFNIFILLFIFSISVVLIFGYIAYFISLFNLCLYFYTYKIGLDFTKVILKSKGKNKLLDRILTDYDSGSKNYGNIMLLNYLISGYIIYMLLIICWYKYYDKKIDETDEECMERIVNREADKQAKIREDKIDKIMKT